MKKRPSIAPGQVWWCDGGALGFEAHFKTRPVLVVARAAEGDGWLVMPLSSRRRFGQEPMVTHGDKTSFMTGHRAIVLSESLLSYSGDWTGFAAWSQTPPSSPPLSFWNWLRRLFRRR